VVDCCGYGYGFGFGTGFQGGSFYRGTGTTISLTAMRRSVQIVGIFMVTTFEYENCCVVLALVVLCVKTHGAHR